MMHCSTVLFYFSPVICLSLSLVFDGGEELTVELIEKVGQDNVYWTVDQLAGMSNKTFFATLETLGAITDYSADQLAVLSEKAAEVQWRH